MPFFKNAHQLDIYYEILSSEKSKCPLICVHGYGSSAYIFAAQIPVLQEFFTLILLDVEGHGRSEKPTIELQEKLVKQTVADLEQLLTLLDVRSPIGIMGHSIFGCDVAMQYTLHHPEMTKFLILLNGSNLILDSTIRNMFWNLLPQITRMHFDEMIQTALFKLKEKIIPFILSAVVHEETTISEQEKTVLYQKIETDIDDFVDKQLDVQYIKNPCLIIGSELDNYAPAYMAKNLHHQIPHSEFFIISMTGHFGLSQRTTEFNRIILNFLEKSKLIS